MGSLAMGCVSKSEHEKVLGNYRRTLASLQTEQKAHAETQAALDAERQRVATLEADLQKMGAEFNSISAQLEQSGTEKAQLTATRDQLQRALDEYRARAEQLEKIKHRFESLRDKLNKLTQIGLKVEVRHNRMVIRLPGDVLFASGSDDLKEAGTKVLSDVAAVIRNDPQLSMRYYQVAGHTDDRPLAGGVFRDNWGLSLMRARGVLLYLVSPLDKKGGGGGGLNPVLLHAAGYGETDPAVPNDDEAKRTANRRVELVLLPDVEEMLDLKQLL
jgi:chemotaxis protein MotB